MIKNPKSKLGDTQVHTPTAPILKRELEYSERATWGTCSFCHAQHGEYCFPCGPSFGMSVDGKTHPTNGVHLCRLKDAPFKIIITPL